MTPHYFYHQQPENIVVEAFTSFVIGDSRFLRNRCGLLWGQAPILAKKTPQIIPINRLVEAEKRNNGFKCLGINHLL